MDKLELLLLCNRPAKNADASTVTDHLDAFVKYSAHSVTQLSFIREMPEHLILDKYDALIIHYSLAIGYLSEHYLSGKTKDKIRNFKGLKIVFIQDEYRSVNLVLDTLRYIGAHVLYTCVPDSEIDKVYPNAILGGLTKINTLTGYIPEALSNKSVPTIKERLLHVGYRARKPPFWLGELGYEKWNIADRFMEHVDPSELLSDISYEESDRIYGDKWIQFVMGTKCMLGVESGASVFDFHGNLQRIVDEYLSENPDATFFEVQEKFLKPYEGLIRLNQISPRCFEAIALRTVLILYEGEYSGILKPWRHFIPLAKDFSNIDDVLSVIMDDDRLQKIADRAYEQIAMNHEYSYRNFIQKFDESVGKEFRQRGLIPVDFPYSKLSYTLALCLSWRYSIKRISSIMIQRLLLGTPLRRYVFRIWGGVPLRARAVIRPLLKLMGR